MSKKSLLLGAIASIIAINSVLADTTVTSRNYVDTQVATKQNKIDATGANFTNGSVVETTSTPGVVTQRAIFDPQNNYDFDTNEIATGHENDLVTAGIWGFTGYNIKQIYNQIAGIATIDNLPITVTTNKVCTEWVANAEHTDTNCLLWNLVEQEVYGGVAECERDRDCLCESGEPLCDHGKCGCIK